jgi:hypothetical protein
MNRRRPRHSQNDERPTIRASCPIEVRFNFEGVETTCRQSARGASLGHRTETSNSSLSREQDVASVEPSDRSKCGRPRLVREAALDCSSNSDRDRVGAGAIPGCGLQPLAAHDCSKNLTSRRTPPRLELERPNRSQVRTALQLYASSGMKKDGQTSENSSE